MISYRFCREVGGLVPVDNRQPAPGENWTRFMDRLNREQREAEAREPMLDIGANPWLPAHWNVTNQMRLQNRNPELASELRRQAGVAD